MRVKAIKTEKILPEMQSLIEVVDKYVSSLKEGSILVITSKIVSTCEGSVLKMEDSVDKHKLIQKYAERFIPPGKNAYGMTITITNNLLLPTAGIDESNANGYYILWPKDAQASANEVREHLSKKHDLKHVGVLITDSKTTPLRWGTTGVGVAHSGFEALRNYIRKPDIFGRKMKVTKANVMDGLSAAAVVVMGEGKEQTPLAIIDEADFMDFQDRNPTDKELRDLKISMEYDIYAEVLKSAPWEKGKAYQA